jgi:hypothetical protein
VLAKVERKMSTGRIALAVVIACIAANLPLPAAGTPPSRLVFKDPERETLHGTLRLQTADTVIFDDGLTGTPDTLALADVFLIETNVGPSPKLNNVVIGVFLGTLTGLVIGMHRADDLELAPIIGAGAGFFVGLGLGAIPTATWEPVYLSAEARERRERLRWP